MPLLIRRRRHLHTLPLAPATCSASLLRRRAPHGCSLGCCARRSTAAAGCSLGCCARRSTAAAGCSLGCCARLPTAAAGCSLGCCPGTLSMAASKLPSEPASPPSGQRSDSRLHTVLANSAGMPCNSGGGVQSSNKFNAGAECIACRCAWREGEGAGSWYATPAGTRVQEQARVCTRTNLPPSHQHTLRSTHSSSPSDCSSIALSMVAAASQLSAVHPSGSTSAERGDRGEAMLSLWSSPPLR